MRISPRLIKFGGPSLMVVGLIGWYLGRFLGLRGWPLWGMRLSVWLLGALAVFLIYRILPQKKAKDGVPQHSEISEILKGAARKLISVGAAGKKGLRSVPVVLFMGPNRSAKTSVVQQAGVETDFLAGDGADVEPPPPTSTMNLWLSRGTVFLEAGESVSKDEGAWDRVLDFLKTGSWSALFKEQPSRIAVVCVGAEWLMGNDQTALTNLAKELRTRLESSAVTLDRRLPVYVLFTKSDQIPHFTEYTRNLAEADALQPLGVTLPLSHGEDPGLYNQWQSARLAQSLESVFKALARRRLDVMTREGDGPDRSAAYEFPREFRKVVDLAQDFLLELTRPSQLRVSPYLRGFYFTGIRPVAMNARPDPVVAAPMPQSHKGATMVFDPSQAMASAPSQPASGGRKAQWTFLPKLLPDVILPDSLAVEASMGGPKAAFRKRALVGLGLGAVSLLILFFFFSFLGNRGLQRETLEAMQAVEDVRGGGGSVPSLEDLERLDVLRAQVEKLAEYQWGTPPLRLRWGLFSGSTAFFSARRLYFDRFRDLLFEPTRAAIVTSLGALSEEPTQEEYEAKYRALKAYLIMTSFPDSSLASFMGPALLEEWKGDRPLDEERQGLVRAQFDFYASELPHQNPYGVAADNLTVERARSFLRTHANEQSFYSAMLSQANSQFSSIQFNRDYPGSGRFVVNTMEVPGAFTQGGWQFVLQGLSSVSGFFQRESYVVGGDYFSGIDPDAMAETLRGRYQEEYVQTWVDFLAAASISNPGLRGAEGSLSELASPSSPLFRLLAIASENTMVDSVVVGPAFQPLHVVSPPEVTDRLFGEAALPYLSELGNLAGAMGRLASDPGSSGAQDDAATAAQSAAGEIDALRLSFNTAPAEAQAVGSSIESLLRAPVRYARNAIGQSDVAAMDTRGQAFCRGVGSVLQRFPFSVGGSDASLSEVNALLHPDDGELWALVDEIRGEGLTLSPEFESFVSRARAISQVFYAHGGPDPSVRFRLRGQPSDEVPEIVLNVDGDEEGYRRRDTRWGNFTWEAGTAQELTLRARVGEQTDSLNYRGTWAIFKLFHQADWQGTGSTWRLSWTLDDTGANVQADLDLAGAEPIFRRGFFDGLSCPRRFVR